jgi:pimeloyl-ACP methyl ester carboxylesterase
VNLGDGLAAHAVPNDGETVFWIHGYTLDSTCWHELWDNLPHHAHIGVDLPGHGNSLPLRADEDLSGLARTIGALAISREARHLVGLSLGNVVALQIALEFPGAFSTLTLGSPMLGGGPFEPDIWKRYGDVKASFAKRGYGPHLADRWMDPGAALFQGAGRYPHLYERLQRQVVTHPWWELDGDEYARFWRLPQYLRNLSSLGVPALVVTGESDSAAVRESAAFLERLVPRCARRDLPDTGHLCLLEDPAAVAPLIEDHWHAHAAHAHAT